VEGGKDASVTLKMRKSSKRGRKGRAWRRISKKLLHRKGPNQGPGSRCRPKKTQGKKEGSVGAKELPKLKQGEESYQFPADVILDLKPGRPQRDPRLGEEKNIKWAGGILEGSVVSPAGINVVQGKRGGESC